MATERSFNINENTSSSIDAPVFIELQETQAALKDAEAQNELKETELADMREKYGAQTLELEYTRSQLAKSMQEKADSATESTPTTGSTTDQSDSQAISPLMFLSSLSPRDPSSSSRSYNLSTEVDQTPNAVRKVVPCAKCYVQNWKCDTVQPCYNCEFRDKGKACKRVMCKHYKAGSCQDLECIYAHEGDGYLHLMPYRKLRQVENDNIQPAALRDELSNGDIGDRGGIFGYIRRTIA